MTAIAIADGEGAADTQATADNTIYRVQKMMRMPDGGFAAGAGVMREIYRALVWLSEGAEGDEPCIKGSTIAIVKQDKSIWLAEGGWPAFPIMDRTVTIGCGADLARQALDDGLSPAEAVCKACKLDAYSSGPVYVMRVQEMPEIPQPIPPAPYERPIPAPKAKITGKRK